MKFPVDLLTDVCQEELEQSAQNYMNNLLYSSPDSPEHLTFSDSTQVTIDISSVGFIPLYGSSDKQKILALFFPSDPFTAVALYLLDQWWAVDDILKTADPARDGTVEVETVGERIVLYILNRVIYRAKEMSSEDLPFLCHGKKDYAKILWNNGEAVGFYSVKPPGSLCNSFSTRSYHLPLMDSIFIRKCQRGKGFGLRMLEDFVLSFKEDCLGLRYPLTKSMYKVCAKYLCKYPSDIDLLWEVESKGGPNQRTNIASKIQAMDLNAVSKSFSFTEESLAIAELTEKDVEREINTTQIKEAESMARTFEIVEEVTVLRATKEAEEVPVVVRGRSSGSKRRNIAEKTTEDKSEKVIRIEDIEAETPREQQVSVQGKKALLNVSELEQTESMFSIAAVEKGEDAVDSAPEEAAAMMLDKPATVLTSQDLEEADVIAAPMTEEPQVEDDVTQDLKNTSHDSQIIVVNVSSEIEEAEEECQKEDTTVLVVSEEVLEVHKVTETLDKMGEGTEIEVSDEKSEERVTQHKLSLSTHTKSEDVEPGKRGKTVVKTIKLLQNEPHRQSQWYRKPQEGVMEEGAAHRVLSGRTVLNTPRPKHKHTRHSQKVCEELQKEVDEVSATEVVEELAVTEREEQEEIASIKEDEVTVEDLPEEWKQQHEDEQLTTNKEETEKQEEPGVEDSVVKKSFTELPDTTETALAQENEDEKVTNDSEKEQKDEEVETSVIQDKQEVRDDEIEEPPVVQRRAVTGRHNISPKPKPGKQSKRQQKKEDKYKDEADLGVGGSAEEKTDEQAVDKKMAEHYQVEQEESVDKTEEEISTEELTVVTGGTIPKADEATDNIIPSTEVNMEETKDIQEEEETDGETETVSAGEADKKKEAVGVTGGADDIRREPDSVAPASETVLPDEVRNEAVVQVADELQAKDIGSEIPNLQKATVILVDFKAICHHLSMNEAEEKIVDGECAAPENEQMELITAEEGAVSRCVAEEQTSEPEMLMLEEEVGWKQKNITEISVDATADAETVKKEELEEDHSEKEKEKCASVDGKKSDGEEALVIETRVLRSERKTVEASCKSRGGSNQQQEENNIVEGIYISEVCADTEADIPVGDDAEGNLPPAEVDEVMSLEEEEAPVGETRALRSGTKAVTATPPHKTTGSRKQLHGQEAENSEEEELAVRIRTLRQRRISACAPPKSKPRRTCKQIREEELKVGEESKIVKETGVGEEDSAEESAVKNTNEEREEKMEEIREKVEEAASEREESLEREIDVQEGKAVAEEGQNEVEEQSEVISKAFAEREIGASGEEYNERNPIMGVWEVELPPAALTRSLRSGGKTSKDPPKTRPRKSKKQEDDMREKKGASVAKSADGDELPVERRILRRVRKSVSRSCKQLLKKTEELKESAEAEVEEKDEAGLGSAKEPPIEGDKGEAPEEERTEVEKEELVSLEVEKRVSEEGTMKMTREEENTATVTAAADDLVQEGETDPPLAKPDTDSAIVSEKEATPSTKEQQSEEIASQLSDLQRVTVVLVDLKKAHHEFQGETSAVEEGVHVEKIAVEAEKEQRGETMKQKETVVEEHITGSPAEIEKTELEKVVVEEEGLEEKVEDVVTIWGDTGEADGTKITESRKGRSTRQAVKATPRCKSARQKRGEEEKEVASEISEEEPVMQVRVLRRGRKSVPVAQKCKITRTKKQLQGEQEEEGEGGEEYTGVEKREAEEEEENIKDQQQMIDQEKGERLEEKDATQQVENIEPEMGLEKTDTMAEEAVTQQDAPEVGQAGSTETVDESSVAPVGQSADERKTSEDDAEEAVATQNTVEGEQSVFISEVAETAVGESARKTLLTAKDGKGKGVSEEKETSVIETRILRSVEKAVRGKTKNRQDDEQEMEAAGEKSAEGDEPAVETKVLRKVRRSAPATRRHKSKRAHTQCQPEEEAEEVTTLAEETEGEETKADEKEKDYEEAVAQKEENTVEEESFKEQETVEEEQSAVSKTCADGQGEAFLWGSAEETPNTNTGKVIDEEEAPVIEPRLLRSGEKAVKATPRSKTTNSQQEENGREGTVLENSADTDEPAETRVLRKGRRSAHATPRHKSKRACTQNQPEEVAEDVTTTAKKTEGEEEEAGQESPVEKGEKAEEEGKLMETEAEKKKYFEEGEVESAAGIESVVGDAEQMKDALTEETVVLEKEDILAEDIEENQAKEKADYIDNRVLEPAAEEPAIEEMESSEEESSGESKEDKTVDPSVVEGRNLRRRMKIANKEENKAEEIHLLKRRSIRKKPRVDYRENYDEDEGGETEAAIDKEEEDKVESDEDEENKKAECSADEKIEKLEESNKEENLEKDMVAIESTSEKGGILSLVSDTDEEVETAAISQEHEEDEQNISEKEVEPIVIGKRVLRGRSVPSVIITTRSKPRCRSALVQKVEESLSDEKTSLQLAQKRSLRKRKSTEVTPTRKSKRHSRV
ncbi:A-kinase anchor protein 12-like [Xiphias gladius]|uniref:A-kinase anchor protein 12-like n=1 Tax=Xiphias gladius TaxID=8245 RepID=UPI001A992A65|nr:A-kinase anchor protein 12-like [Xiphias gladius]